MDVEVHSTCSRLQRGYYCLRHHYISPKPTSTSLAGSSTISLDDGTCSGGPTSPSTIANNNTNPSKACIIGSMPLISGSKQTQHSHTHSTMGGGGRRRPPTSTPLLTTRTTTILTCNGSISNSHCKRLQ